jgi:hypothetical protein
MRTAKKKHSFISAGASGHRRARVVAGVALLVCLSDLTASDLPKVDPLEVVAEMRRLGARKPFLIDSPDVYFEPKSLNHFFTEAIYRKLRGNPYFGYDYDEGFFLQDNAVHIELLKDLTPMTCCQAAFRVALAQALETQGLVIKPLAQHQIGVCIVGVEPKETPNTLPGLMVEAYLRNSVLKKSFFIRYGAGHPRGLAAAVRLSAEMLAAKLAARRPTAISNEAHDTERQRSR